MHQIEGWFLYGFFGFFATLGVYNGERLFKSTHAIKTPWLSWVKKNSFAITILISLSFVVVFLILFNLNQLTVSAYIILGVCGFISAFYVIRLKGKNMRELPYAKIHLIALSWTLILVIFPLVNEGISNNIILLGLAHYMYIMAIAIPFDIRDLKYDLKSQRTIPQILGLKFSKMLALVLLIGFTAIMLSIYNELQLNVFFYVGVLAQGTFIFFMNEKRSDYYCALGIDGSIALLGISYFTLSLV